MISLLFRLVCNVGNAFFNNIGLFFDKHFNNFYFGSHVISLIVTYIVLIFGESRLIIIIELWFGKIFYYGRIQKHLYKRRFRTFTFIIDVKKGIHTISWLVL